MFRASLHPLAGLLLLLVSTAHAGSVSDALKSAAGVDPFAELRAAEKQFLQPEQAFPLYAEAVAADRVRLSGEAVSGYYLYRDKFSFSVNDPAVSIENAIMPAGDDKFDEHFGQVKVFHGAFTIDLPLAHAAGKTLALSVRSQGCAEAGICYPPQTKTFTLQMPATGAMGGNTPASAAATPDLNETDRFAVLLTEASLLKILLAFFVIGVGLSLTPCVYPMLPILGGILIGQGAALKRGQAFALSLAYVLAMALTYSLAGVAAGYFGGNIQAAMQQPPVLIAFALVFVALALSMFGVYDLQMPSAWQSKLSGISNQQQSGSLAGAAVMGALSALIVGPCVAPPLAGALLYIGQTGNALLGGAALFVLSLGMGIPLLILGASAGTLLPRAGAWMVAVKKFFGFLMLGVAWWFVSRLLPASGSLALLGVLLLTASVFAGAFDHLPAHSGNATRFKKIFGLLLALAGALQLWGAASGARDPLRPLAGGQMHAADGLRFQRVQDTAALATALQTAAGKTIMLYFYADWCVECKKLEHETFTDAGVRAALTDTVLLQADVTDNDASAASLLKQFALLGPPAMLFFDAAGNELRAARLQGFYSAAQLRAHLSRHGISAR